MKKLQSTFFFLMMMGAQTILASSIPLDFVERMAKQINYIEQSPVWPGFHQAETASIIQFKNNNINTAYALNFKPGELPWKKIISSYPIYFLQNASILNLEIDNAFTQVDGQRSYIDIEDPDFINQNENIINKFMVERAYYYLTHEASIKFNPSDLSISYNNFNNLDLLKLFYLEDAALTLAQQDDAEHAEEALRDAVAIHQYRDQLSSDSARKFENMNDLFYGTSFFISWSSQQLNEADYRKMTQRTGCMPLSSLLDPLAMMGCVLGQFPAFSSSVYGHALDKKILNYNWKKNVEKEFKSPARIAIDYYHFTEQEMYDMVEKAMRKPNYHYDRIVRIIDHNMLAYLESMNLAQKRYKELPGIEVRTPFVLGFVILISKNFLPDIFSDMYFPNQYSYLLENLNFNEPIPPDPNEMYLNMDHLPYMDIQLMQKDFDNSYLDLDHSFTAFKINEKTELILDGSTISANDFLRTKQIKSFHNIVIKDSHIVLKLPFEGILDASGNMLKLNLDSVNNKFKFSLKRNDYIFSSEISAINLRLYSYGLQKEFFIKFLKKIGNI
jgi:hypothetical protein